MKISDKIYQNILEQLNDGVYYVNTLKNITYWNKAAERISGYTKDDILGKCCADNLLRHVDDLGTELCKDGCPLDATLADGQTREKVVYLHHKNGHRVKVFTRVTPISDDDGSIIGAVELFNDVTKVNQSELIEELERLKKEAYSDALTGCGNRRFAELTVQRCLNEWKELKVPFSVFFIDIDGFKSFNDRLGHHTGDKILTMVGKSILASVRGLDVVCRWGGDEFVVISPNLSGEIVHSVGERIRSLIEHSWIDHDSRKLTITVSIGGATFNPDDTIESLFARADNAMYQSKSKGKNTFTVN